jgi:N-methylhydantoinase B/oxoprolinase/acetone carboxylase alpha subunit
MTNTLNTPAEALELAYPFRITTYGVRHGSGGAGRHPGGDGAVRAYAFIEPATVTLVTERRTIRPWGLAGGAPGEAGHNILRHAGRYVAIDPKPYLSDREYDLFSWLRNPLFYRMTDRVQTERRIAAFVAAGLDDRRIRVWAIIRGAYLTDDPEELALLESLLD